MNKKRRKINRTNKQQNARLGRNKEIAEVKFNTTTDFNSNRRKKNKTHKFVCVCVCIWNSGNHFVRLCVRVCGENLIYLRLDAERVYVDIDFYDSRNDIAWNSQCPVNCTDSIPHTDPVRWILLFKYIYEKREEFESFW